MSDFELNICFSVITCMIGIILGMQMRNGLHGERRYHDRL